LTGHYSGILETVTDHERRLLRVSCHFWEQGDDVRKKLNAAAGLVTIAAAGALIASSPAAAEGQVMPVQGSVTSVETNAAPVEAYATYTHPTTTVAGDDHRRHRRHHRRHRHHRHHHHGRMAA
jgi:hypothetical protein